MDLTLLRIETIRTRSPIRNLSFRDLTLDCRNAPLIDLAGDAPATVKLQRCRVVGFDGGAGGSVMVYGRKVAFYAIDSRFEGGYGRAPGKGNLFRVRTGLLVRMERCRIRGPLASCFDAGPRARYLFSDCEFLDLAPAQKARLHHPPEGVRIEGGGFAASPAGSFQHRRLIHIRPEWR